jgi:GNAT superfamily N-acetyltransferase
MEYSIRPATTDDIETVDAFTQDTFEWGDYIGRVLPAWLAAARSRVLVAADAAGTAVAVGRGLLVSSSELWLQGARVHPDWRRKGIASAVGEALLDWARGQGARIARLAVEEWNQPARNQVERSGFTHTSDWAMARRSIDSNEPSTGGNGGRRTRARQRLVQAHSSEALPAWLSWQSGPLAGSSRGLFFSEWRWRRLTLADLEEAARDRRLWTSEAGWICADAEEGLLTVSWLECGPEDAADLIRSIIDLAIAADCQNAEIMLPSVDWLLTTATGLRWELSPMAIYECPI